MALNAAAQTAAGNGLSAVITHLAIHTAAPDAAGSNQSTAACVAVTWTNTAGDLTSGSKNFTGGAASGPATHVGLWGALTGGTFYGLNNALKPQIVAMLQKLRGAAVMLDELNAMRDRHNAALAWIGHTIT